MTDDVAEHELLVSDLLSCREYLSGARAEVERLNATINLIRASAYAAVNPANWQKNNTPEARLEHYERTLDELGEAGGGERRLVEDLWSRATKAEAERDEAQRIKNVWRAALTTAETERNAFEAERDELARSFIALQNATKTLIPLRLDIDKILEAVRIRMGEKP